MKKENVQCNNWDQCYYSKEGRDGDTCFDCRRNTISDNDTMTYNIRSNRESFGDKFREMTSSEKRKLKPNAICGCGNEYHGDFYFDSNTQELTCRHCGDGIEIDVVTKGDSKNKEN